MRAWDSCVRRIFNQRQVCHPLAHGGFDEVGQGSVLPDCLQPCLAEKVEVEPHGDGLTHRSHHPSWLILRNATLGPCSTACKYSIALPRTTAMLQARVQSWGDG